ncbi:sensor histidine kinase [Sediminitomix flava]|uniref:histidine kinase n=1 Tax=Sediminitomix flava TaxID=379075 RepID=A0A315ZFT9_SEDFL|nr:7TM diverse intracellular signaling domain-containing protein [Sediminitomix flava]PWJ44381.1 signal transduction histidine kinase [Sediminitomix flava]
MSKYTFSLLLFFFSFQFSFGQPIEEEILFADQVNERLDLTPFLYHYSVTPNFDGENLPTFTAQNWEKVPSSGLDFGPGSDQDWFKFQVRSQEDVVKSIFTSCPSIPILDIWLIEEETKIVQSIHLGTERRFLVSMPKIKSGFTYNAEFKKGSNYTCYIHFQAFGQPHLSNIYLADPSLLEEETNTLSRYFIVFRTVTTLIIFLSLILFAFTRQKFFLYYSMFFLSIFLFTESEIGTLWIIFEKDTYSTFLLVRYWANTGIILCSYLFFRRILNEPKGVYLFKSDKWLHPLIIAAIACCVLFSVFRYNSYLISSISSAFVIILTYVSGVYNLAVCLRRAKEGNELAKYLFIIHLITLSSAFIIVSLPYLGVFGRNINSFLYIYVLYTFEAFAFFIAIVRRAVTILNEREMLILENHVVQKQVSEALIKGQEIERNRIGRELHDYVGGNLALINKTKNFRGGDVRKLIHETIRSVRNLSHGLVSPSFEYEEFEESITDLGAKYNSKDRKVHISFHDWEPSENLTALNHCYRIVQELLQNAEKHSKANSVYIQFFGGKDTRIIYEDNGVGFEDSPPDDGIGLQNISFRAKALGGQLVVESSAQGTFIRIEGINVFGEEL